MTSICVAPAMRSFAASAHLVTSMQRSPVHDTDVLHAANLVCSCAFASGHLRCSDVFCVHDQTRLRIESVRRQRR